jgi:Tir chaperone protein (CesT) family
MHQLMAATAELIDALEISELEDDHYWVFLLDEKTSVEADFDEESERLTLSSDVGVVPAEKREQTFQTCLIYNSLWRQTGGARFGLDSFKETIELVLDLPAAKLEPQILHGILSSFLTAVHGWRMVIESDASADVKQDLLGDLSGGIRV